MSDPDPTPAEPQPSNLDPQPSTKRRFFSFSLRTFLLVVLVVSGGLGFVGYRVEKYRRLKVGVEQLIKPGGAIEYHYAPGPWWEQVLKDDFAESVSAIRSRNVPDQDLELIGQLPRLKRLILRSTDLVDLSVLSELTELTRLEVTSPRITNLSELAGMTQLRTLVLEDVDSADLTPLAGLTKMEWLTIKGAEISDISPLSGMTSMIGLQLSGGEISDVTALASMPSVCAFLNTSSPFFSRYIDLPVGYDDSRNIWLVDTKVSDLTPLAGMENVMILAEESQELVVPESLKGKIRRVPDAEM